MLKTFLIIFLTLAAVVIGGGSYYYFEIYQPSNYAESLLSIYQTLKKAGLQPDTSLVKNETDYAGAIDILERRINLFKSIKSDLVQMQPPKRMTKFHQEFSDYIVFSESQHMHGFKIASFLAKAKDLKELVTQIYKADLTKEKITTIGELQKFWGERIPKTINTASILFKEEISEFVDPSFNELKLLWESGSPAFDIVLNRINATNPNLLIRQVGNVFTPSEQKQLDISTKKIEEFTKKLDALFKKYNAYDLLAFRYFTKSSPAESSERVLKFYQAIQKLKNF